MGQVVRRLGTRGVGRDKLIMLPDPDKTYPAVKKGTNPPKSN